MNELEQLKKKLKRLLQQAEENTFFGNKTDLNAEIYYTRVKIEQITLDKFYKEAK